MGIRTGKAAKTTERDGARSIVNMTIRIDVELKKAIERAALRTDRDLSGYVRFALRRALAAEGFPIPFPEQGASTNVLDAALEGKKRTPR